MNYPEQGELLIATVKKILPYGAFLTLEEYGGMEGFMHISEVAPRWIKNIHEFLSERQKLVVKVHRIDREKGQVDVSLKRVNEQEKKNKLESVRREKRAEKLLEHAVKNSKSKKDLEKLKAQVLGQYDDLYSFMEDLRDSGEEAFEGIDVDAPLRKELLDNAKKYVKKPIVELERIITLKCYENDGVEAVKAAFRDVPAHYLGAGRYLVSITAPDYKQANKEMDKLISKVEKGLKGRDCEFSSEESQ